MMAQINCPSADSLKLKLQTKITFVSNQSLGPFPLDELPFPKLPHHLILQPHLDPSAPSHPLPLLQSSVISLLDKLSSPQTHTITIAPCSSLSSIILSSFLILLFPLPSLIFLLISSLPSCLNLCFNLNHTYILLNIHQIHSQQFFIHLKRLVKLEDLHSLLIRCEMPICDLALSLSSSSLLPITDSFLLSLFLHSSFHPLVLLIPFKGALEERWLKKHHPK